MSSRLCLPLLAACCLATPALARPQVGSVPEPEPTDDVSELAPLGATEPEPSGDVGDPGAAEVGGAEGAAPPARELEAERIRSVQTKEFFKRGRVSLTSQASVSLNDPFYTKALGTLGLAYYLRDTFSIGVRASAIRVLDRPEILEAKANFDVLILSDPPKWLAMAELEWSPIYGKVRLGDSIHTFDGFVVGGAGVVRTRAENPALEVGAGLRFGVTSWLAVNASVLQVLYPSRPSDSEVALLQSLVTVNAGLALLFPFTSTAGAQP